MKHVLQPIIDVLARAPKLALVMIPAFVFVGITAPWLAPYDPIAQDLLASNQGPSRDRWLGTDHLGRDTSSRLIVAARTSVVGMALVLGFETFEASVTGICRNPFDVNAWTCDSSTGSAAAMAGGLIPFALATETRGSIIQPASFCDAVGLRPPVGQVPLDGIMPVSETVDRLGIMARTPDDCATIVEVMAGRKAERARQADRPRIGVVRPGLAGRDKAVIKRFDQSLETLASIFDFTAVELPHLPHDDAYREIAVFEAKRNFKPLIEDGTVAALISPLARDGSYLVGPNNQVSYRSALDHRKVIAEQWRAFASPIDARFSDYFGDDDHEPITTVGALLGLPALTIPSELGDRNLPVGIQFVGMENRDADLCNLTQSAFDQLPRVLPPRSNINCQKNAEGFDQC